LSKDLPSPQSGVAALVNTGVHVLNDSGPASAERTIIVLGIARSGTTMVAGALHHLGIPMCVGQRPNGVFEDTEIGRLLGSKDYEALAGLVEARNREHAVWGWKRPDAIDDIPKIERYFRSPEYVVVFRDVFAIANRNRISVRADLLANMNEALARYSRLLAFLASNGRRTLLVSYEKAMLDQKAFVHALAEFARAGSSEQLEQAVAHVRSDDPAYLRWSRNWGGVGHLTVPAHNIIGGWAYLRQKEEGPAMVEITVNGRVLATLRADLVIEDLKRAGHPAGQSGFHLSLPKSWHLQDGDVITARIAGESADLAGSPWIFSRGASRAAAT
jgi:hypothetical protein